MPVMLAHPLLASSVDLCISQIFALITLAVLVHLLWGEVTLRLTTTVIDQRTVLKIDSARSLGTQPSHGDS